MITIALIIPQIGGGGAEKVAADLSLFFTKRGYRVVFFVQSLPTQSSYEFAGEVVTVPIIGESYTGNFLLDLKLLLKQSYILRKKKKEYKVKIAISFMQNSNLINIVSKGKEKVIVTLHNVVSRRNDLQSSIAHNRWTYRFIYQMANKIIFVSKYCRNDWINHYGDMFHKTRVIYNPFGKRRKSETENTLDYGENVVISVGRMEGIKRPWHIIRMFSKVSKAIPDAKLILLGDGVLLLLMKKLAKEMGLEEKAIFLGHVKNVEKYLKIAKVFVMTSSSEAFPCSAVEAISCGVPVVANDCPGGLRECIGIKEKKIDEKLVRGICGVITPCLDGRKYTAFDSLTHEEEMMADEVIYILSDKKIQETYTSNCYKFSKKFDINRIGAMWEKLFKEIVD